MPVALTQPVFPPSTGKLIKATWGDAVSDSVVQRFTSPADRDGKWAGPPKGAVCVTTDTAVPVLWTYDGSVWKRAAGDGTPVGTIIDYYGTAAPAGYLICDGGSTAGYPKLAALCGAKTPDMRGRSTVAVGGNGITSLGAKFGSANAAVVSHRHSVDPPRANTGKQSVGHTHTIPHHRHGLADKVNVTGLGPAGSGGRAHWNSYSPSQRYTLTDGGGKQTFNISANHTHPIDIPAFNSASAGASGANKNWQPSMAVLKCIKHD